MQLIDEADAFLARGCGHNGIAFTTEISGNEGEHVRVIIDGHDYRTAIGIQWGLLHYGGWML